MTRSRSGAASFSMSAVAKLWPSPPVPTMATAAPPISGGGFNAASRGSRARCSKRVRPRKVFSTAGSQMGVGSAASKTELKAVASPSGPAASRPANSRSR